jgi:osmotically-inducible protein OsmY
MNDRVQKTMGLGTIGTLERQSTTLLQYLPASGSRAIPPERVGVHGEYDHNGLAKRVRLAFREYLDVHSANQLEVRQRGCVVILIGHVDAPQLLAHLAAVALTVEGAAFVETYDIVIPHPQVA